MTSSYQQARELNFTDEQIAEHFIKRDPGFKEKYQQALQMGHKPEEIFNRAEESYKYASEKKKLAQLQSEELDPEIERHLARLTSRGIEQGLGAVGNLRDLVYAAKEHFQNTDQMPNIKGLNSFKLPKVDDEIFKKFEEEIPVLNTIKDLIGYIPNSKDIKKFSEEKTGGYTTAKNDYERIGDEVWENVIQNALPGQGQRNIYRNIAAPIAGVLGKEGVKYLGGSEKSQALTQLGLNIAIPLMAGNAPQLNRQAWQQVRRNVPNVNIQTAPLLQRAQGIRTRIQRGLGSKSENQATRTLDNLIEKLERGTISADELMASNISLNEIVGDPALFGRGGHWFEEIRGIIRDGMEQVGQHAPEWYQQWQHANEIHGAIANSNFIANTIRKHAEKPVSEGAKALFYGAVHTTAKGAAVIPPLYAIYKGTQVLSRMANSPQLLRYYTEIMTNSLRGNVAGVASNMKKLDDALLKEEKKKGNPSPKSSSPKK